MIIKSPFKDYYDFVAHQFGGGDPRVVYNRNRLKTETRSSIKDSDTLTSVFVEGRLIRREAPNVPFAVCNKYSVKYLAVVGKYYLVVTTTEEDFSRKTEILTPELSEKIWGPDNKRSSKTKELKYYVGDEDPLLIEVSRQIGAPVFMIEGSQYQPGHGWASVINPTIPILGSIGGFAGIYPPEQLYQDLAYFMGNKMTTSPDLVPPAAVADKDRITQHGFDLKTSFRHRK